MAATTVWFAVACNTVKRGGAVAPLTVPDLEGIGMGNRVIMAILTRISVKHLPPGIVVGVGAQ